MMISQCMMSVLKENFIMSIEAWRAAEELAAEVFMFVLCLAWLLVLTLFSTFFESPDCRGDTLKLRVPHANVGTSTKQADSFVC